MSEGAWEGKEVMEVVMEGPNGFMDAQVITLPCSQRRAGMRVRRHLLGVEHPCPAAPQAANKFVERTNTSMQNIHSVVVP